MECSTNFLTIHLPVLSDTDSREAVPIEDTPVKIPTTARIRTDRHPLRLMDVQPFADSDLL